MKNLSKAVIKEDPYLDDDLCVDRLYENYLTHNKLIVAFDFDNTVNDYYELGYTYPKVVQLLKECKELDFVLILFTCCDESKYEYMLMECEKIGIKVDYVNQSPPYIPYHSCKVYYNILLNDRAGLSSSYYILRKVVDKIKTVKRF